MDIERANQNLKLLQELRDLRLEVEQLKSKLAIAENIRKRKGRDLYTSEELSAHWDKAVEKTQDVDDAIVDKQLESLESSILMRNVISFLSAAAFITEKEMLQTLIRNYQTGWIDENGKQFPLHRYIHDLALLMAAQTSELGYPLTLNAKLFNDMYHAVKFAYDGKGGSELRKLSTAYASTGDALSGIYNNIKAGRGESKHIPIIGEVIYKILEGAPSNYPWDDTFDRALLSKKWLQYPDSLEELKKDRKKKDRNDFMRNCADAYATKKGKPLLSELFPGNRRPSQPLAK